MSLIPARRFRALCAAALLAGSACAAMAQAACSSDGRPAARAIVERFIPDACEACWRSSDAATHAHDMVLDWIVPGGSADAPLAAAAVSDALTRLSALHAIAGTATLRRSQPVTTHPRGHLRVAHGQAVGDYLGTAIAWTPGTGPGAPYTAWLLLVEDLPAGTSGTPIPRTLVRNALVVEGIAAGRARWSERRSMRFPEGADPARLHVAGWMVDAGGRVVAAVDSRCSR